jgi:tRNA threonylcarbamoyl adenosine modification protein YeaZ
VRLLVIDTSGPECAAGIYDAGAACLVSAQSATIGKGHAEVLPGMIETVAAEAGLALNMLDRIAVTVGPGSFTGIRVGVAMARGLALALKIPAVGVSTLQVVAEPALGHNMAVLALIDARRDELYAQLFSSDGAAISQPAALSAEAAHDLAKMHGAVPVGSGAHILAGKASPQIDLFPLLTIGAIAARLATDIAARPLYIRGADAKPQTRFAVAHA